MDHFCNAADILFANGSAGRENKVALLTPDASLSYGDLAGLTQRVAAGLSRLGVERENRVALLLPDCPELVAGFLGTMACGAVAVPLNTSLLAPDYEFFLTDSRAKVLITSSRLWFLVQSALAGCPHLRAVVVTGEPVEGGLGWDEFLGSAEPSFTPVATHPDEAAFWLYTSGSTGRPKAAVHSHANLLFSCRTYGEQVLQLRPEDICFSSAKLFHAYGLGNSLSFPLRAGATTVLWHGPPLAEALFEWIARFRPTVFFGTPAVFVAMLGCNATAKPDLSSIRFCVSAGESLPAAIFEKWKARFGLEIVDGIGSTEMLHIFISNTPGDARAGTTGRIVPGYRAKVVSENGDELPKGEIGDLWVSGGSSALGYHNNKARTQSTFRGEWVVTGDKYREDADGYFHYQGRADDMLKINGLWVSPVEIEQHLAQCSSVAECAVVAVTDEDGLLQSKAFVVLREGIEPSENLRRELQGFLKQRLPQRYPRLFEFVPGLPRTASGKLQRFRLREERPV